jgi:hypothetical protein
MLPARERNTSGFLSSFNDMDESKAQKFNVERAVRARHAFC